MRGRHACNFFPFCATPNLTSGATIGPPQTFAASLIGFLIPSSGPAVVGRPGETSLEQRARGYIALSRGTSLLKPWAELLFPHILADMQKCSRTSACSPTSILLPRNPWRGRSVSPCRKKTRAGRGTWGGDTGDYVRFARRYWGGHVIS